MADRLAKKGDLLNSYIDSPGTTERLSSTEKSRARLLDIAVVELTEKTKLVVITLLLTLQGIYTILSLWTNLSNKPWILRTETPVVLTLLQ